MADTSDIEYRLSRVETIIAARRPGLLRQAAQTVSRIIGDWNEALHPRGKDGRFIETNGSVAGPVRRIDGNGRISPEKVNVRRARTKGFHSGNGATPEDPWVLVEVDGPEGTFEAVARASEIGEAADVKARLDAPEPATPEVPEEAPSPEVPEQPAIPDTEVVADGELTPERIGEIQSQAGDAIPVTDVEEAVRLLGEGKKIELQQPEQVSTLLDRLVEIVNDAKARGEQAPNYDLCNVTAAGTNLFCAESKGIKRINMPQLAGTPIPGSPADALPRTERGVVDLGPAFRKMLEDRGVAVTDATRPASHLRASQSELNGAQVAVLANRMANGEWQDRGERLFVSNDDYIVDGHHRWAATVGNSLGQQEDIDMDVAQVDMPILDLLAEASRFAEEMGLPSRGHGEPDEATRREAEIEAARLESPLPPDDDRLESLVLSQGYVESPGDRGPMAREQVTRLTADEVREYVNNASRNLSTTNSDQRASQLDGVLAGAFLSPLDSDSVHDKLGVDKDQWTLQRSDLHESMWDDLISRITAAGVPTERDALVLGGLPGAGKSSALKPGGPAERFGVVAWDPGETLTPPEGATHVSINPDSIKEMLIDYHGLPPGIEGLKPMEQVTFIHEESSFLSKEFLRRLQSEGYNVVLDNTMETQGGMLKRMVPLAGSGYRFRGLFVDISPEESKASARRRYSLEFDTERGGRFVSSAVQGHRVSERGRMSANRDAFDALAGINEDDSISGTGWFQEFIVVDNTGVSHGDPLREVTVEGSGDGSPAAEFAPAAPAAV